jgi:hypothetical protein
MVGRHRADARLNVTGIAAVGARKLVDRNFPPL